MCGIAGLLRFSDDATSDADANGHLERMRAFLVARGPDQTGRWVSNDRRAQLVHTRLSILDLTEAGRQPFHSASGRTTIVFNGEIYNFRTLAADLAATGWQPRSGSDTEVLVELLERDGADATLPRLDGMFAFAAFCHTTRSLTLARDPFGEKPLYFAQLRSAFAFSSDPRSIRAFADSPLSIDYAAIRDYLYWGYLPGTSSPWIGVEKLRPGTWLRIADQGHGSFDVRRGRYYSAPARAAEVRRAPVGPLDPSAFDTMIGEVVASRMIADVPVGALLSGGVDSSLVTAHAARATSRLSTFTIGFTDAALDEAPFARDVAAYLGTDHHEWYLTEREAEGSIDDLIALLGEPLGDSSLLPTFLVSRLASSHVKVVLSGDGGDEMFAGYTRYLRLGMVRRFQRIVPPRIRRAAADLALSAPAAAMATRLQSRRLPDALRVNNLPSKLDRIGTMLRTRTVADAYTEMTTAAADVFCERSEAVDHATIGSDWLDDVMLRDTTNYLPDDLCAKVDRASMACGLEVRAPFISKRIFDEAWRFPRSELFHGSRGKWPLRRALAARIPRALVERPKAGFGIPLHDWLRTGLRGRLVEATRDAGARHHLDAAGVDVRRLDDVLSAHLAGQRDHGYELWNVLILSLWLSAYA